MYINLFYVHFCSIGGILNVLGGVAMFPGKITVVTIEDWLIHNVGVRLFPSDQTRKILPA